MIPGQSLLAAIPVGVRRVLGRLTGPQPGRTLIAIVGVSAAIGVLVVVTGLALGLAGTGTVDADETDYWVVPEGADVGTTPFAYEGARLSGVHSMTEELRDDERIENAHPVAFEPVNLYNEAEDESAFVLVMGVVPQNHVIAGIDTSTLDTSYPYYNDGGYNGTWTGELLASSAAAELLATDASSTVSVVDGDSEFEVQEVLTDGHELGFEDVPVVVTHLAELQSVAGLTESDQADQILVSASSSDVPSDIEATYDGVSVSSESGFDDLAADPTSLPFALAVGAALTSLGLGVAFVATMMGLELTATRTQTALLQAIGFTRGSMTALVLTETVTIAILGGLLGVALGFLGIIGINAGAASVFELPAIATMESLLAVYGLGAAVLVGLIAVCYPLYITFRTDTLEELTR